MRSRFLLSALGVVVTAVSVAAQSQTGGAPARAKSTANAPAPPKGTEATKAGWTAPRTPWGHPDISGTWTSDGAIGIPMARPDQFAGRVELTEMEFADCKET